MHLAAFVDDPADFAHRTYLKSFCASVTLAPLHPATARLRSLQSLGRGEPLTFGYYRDQQMVRAVSLLRRKPLAGEYAFSSSMAPYLEPAVEGRPRIADICDADSEKWREYAGSTALPMKWVYGREHRRLAGAETGIVNRFDAALAISDAEARIFTTRQGVTGTAVTVGNGVDTDYFAAGASTRPTDAGDVVFIGAMDYKPNIDAALWFADAVWPTVRARRPLATFTIVGARPPSEVQTLAARDGVAVTGRVTDVRPYLHHARLALAPLKIARGVQNKVLEAMAAGKAVVASTAANVGIDAVAGSEIVIADTAGAFASSVLLLLGDEARARAIGAAARARAARDFSWASRLNDLDLVLRRVGVRDS